MLTGFNVSELAMASWISTRQHKENRSITKVKGQRNVCCRIHVRICWFMQVCNITSLTAFSLEWKYLPATQQNNNPLSSLSGCKRSPNAFEQCIWLQITAFVAEAASVIRCFPWPACSVYVCMYTNVFPKTFQIVIVLTLSHVCFMSFDWVSLFSQT